MRKARGCARRGCGSESLAIGEGAMVTIRAKQVILRRARWDPPAILLRVESAQRPTLGAAR